MTEETTCYMDKNYTWKYRYFEGGHTCKIKVKPGNFERRIRCDCKVLYWRIPRLWYKPIHWMKGKADRLVCFIERKWFAELSPNGVGFVNPWVRYGWSQVLYFIKEI